MLSYLHFNLKIFDAKSFSSKILLKKIIGPITPLKLEILLNKLLCIIISLGICPNLTDNFDL